jgi:hypothetical protein
MAKMAGILKFLLRLLMEDDVLRMSLRGAITHTGYIPDLHPSLLYYFGAAIYFSNLLWMLGPQ